jgi:hypothetical protein
LFSLEIEVQDEALETRRFRMSNYQVFATLVWYMYHAKLDGNSSSIKLLLKICVGVRRILHAQRITFVLYHFDWMMIGTTFNSISTS